MGDYATPNVPLGITEPTPQAALGIQSLPATTDSSSTAGNAELLKSLAPSAPTAPQYIRGTGMKQPNVAAMAPPIPHPLANTNRQPLSNQATSLKQARRQNRFANITNAINQVSNALEKKKFDALKTDIANVTAAQTHIDNAQQILNDKTITDPAVRADAQKVLEDNTKTRDALLNDPKKQKEMAKAFDISFTDPSKNNTYQVKAGQAALKEADQQQKAGLDSNTLAEKKVSDTLKQSVPGSPAPAGMNATPAAVRQAGNAPAPTLTKTASGPSYGQQFADKTRMSGLQVNPQYTQQLEAATKQQELYYQHIIPTILNNENKSQIASMHEQGAMDRTHYVQMNDNLRKLADVRKDIDVANINGMKTVQAAQLRAGAEIKAAQIRVDGAIKLATDPNIQQNRLALKQVKAETVGALDKSISAQVAQLKILKDQMAIEKDPQAQKVLTGQILATNIALNFTQKKREEYLNEAEDGTGTGGNSSPAGTSGLHTKTTTNPSDIDSGKDTDPGGETDTEIDRILREEDSITERGSY